MNAEYSEAAVEVLDILNYTRKADVDKIPKKFIEFLKEQSSKTYKSSIDYSKPLKEANLKSKTKALLGLIYLNYWSNDDEKREFKLKLKENEEKYQQELSDKYNIEKVFNERKKAIIEDSQSAELPAMIKNETFIQRIINKIISFFRR